MLATRQTVPDTAQDALERDLELAAGHEEKIRAAFRRERDRLAADPTRDPVRLAEWVAVFTALWATAGEEVYASTVTDINPVVEPGPIPDFGPFIDQAAQGIVRTTRRRIKAVKALKPTNLSRQLRKLYQIEFIQKRAPRIALDQALRQTATFENAAAKKVEETTGTPLEKVWHNQGDNRVRGSHLSVAAVLLNELFLVGGSELRYPRDPAGSGRETFGCRCWVEHREATEETLTAVEAPQADSRKGYTGYDTDQIQLMDTDLGQLETDFGAQAEYVGSGIDPKGQQLVLAKLEAQLADPGPKGFLNLDDVRADVAHIKAGGDVLTRPSLKIPGLSGANGEVIRGLDNELYLFINQNQDALPSSTSVTGISAMKGTIHHEYAHVFHQSAPRFASPAADLSPDILAPQTFQGVAKAFEDSIQTMTRYSETNLYERVAEAGRQHTTGQRAFPQFDTFRRHIDEAEQWAGTMTAEDGVARIASMIAEY